MVWLSLYGFATRGLSMYQNGLCRKTRKRHDVPGHAHLLTFSCYRNRNFLAADRTCHWLAEAIDHACRKQEISLWAYVFMPNHVHLVVFPRRGEYSVAVFLKQIKEPVARKAIAYLKQHNPAGLGPLATGQAYRAYRFWQKGGGYDRNLTGIDTLIEAVRYIHANPVRKGLVRRATDWRWSSASAWSNGPVGPLPVEKMNWPVFA